MHEPSSAPPLQSRPATAEASAAEQQRHAVAVQGKRLDEAAAMMAPVEQGLQEHRHWVPKSLEASASPRHGPLRCTHGRWIPATLGKAVLAHRARLDQVQIDKKHMQEQNSGLICNKLTRKTCRNKVQGACVTAPSQISISNSFKFNGHSGFRTYLIASND